MSTPARRVGAIAALLETLRPSQDESGTSVSATSSGGRALIYVWALEQKNSRRGWDEGDEQDVMVPWIMKQKPDEDSKSTNFNRYYHLYRRGELEADIACAGGVVETSGYEKENWWAIAIRKTKPKSG